MGAQAVSREVETMPETISPPATTIAGPYSPQQPALEQQAIVKPINASDRKEKLLVLPVLAAAAIAAVIAVFPFQASTLFALFCGEIGLFVASIAISVPRPQKH